jgi:sarcosine oxidase subunit alpha
VRLLARSTVFGYHDENFLTIAQRRTDHLPPAERKGARERVWRVRARQVVLATGAIERPLVFGGNDLPGVMLASAVSCFTNRHAVRLGARAVVFTNNDGAYAAALDLHAAGVRVAAVVDARREPGGALPGLARDAGIEVIDGSVVTRARGGKRIARAEVMGRTVTLKVKFGDFTICTRSKSFSSPVPDIETFTAAGQALLDALHPLSKGIRLVGLGLHNLTEINTQVPAQLGLAI